MTDFDIRYSALRRAVIEREFEKLNDRQRDGVFKTEGPVLILAGAGSGKTTVLINRIINLLRYGSGYECEEAPDFASDEDIETLASYLSDEYVPDEEILRLCAVDPPKPWEIIAITFTNKAAKELRDRLELACGEQGYDIWAHTFHSACTRILRAHIEKLGYPKNFTIYDEDDKKRFVSEVMAELGLSEKIYDIKTVCARISRAKDELKTPADYAAETDGDLLKQATAQIYERYDERMRSISALDFDDIIVRTIELFRTCPDVLEYYQHKFKYVLVDEYQDTNYAQYVLCHELADGYRNLCVVGDDDQSIYKFRGATIENILNFEKEYPDALTIRLEQNYRSTGSILSAANGVISNNRGRKGKNLWTDKGRGSPVYLYRGDTQEDEAQFIAGVINEKHGSGSNFRDFCVLYRNHVLSQPLEYAFQRNGIPYRIVSGLRFFDRKEVKDMLAYLCVIENPADSLRLGRILNVPARGIGAVTQDQVFALAARDGKTEFEVMENAASYPELSRSAAKLSAFTDMIKSLSSVKDNDLMAFYDEVLEKSGYLRMLSELPRAESESKTENVMELKSNISEYCSDTREPTLNGFLEEIALFTDIDRYDVNADAVTMMTIHSAKGLEFENVFLCAAEEGIFPSYRSETGEQIEEERRLCYVAMTRAKRNLYISCAEHRMLYGQTSYARPSRFISEIPEEFVKKLGGEARRTKYEVPFSEKRKMSFDDLFGAKIKAHESKAPSASFAVGQRVRHVNFGEGTVAEVTPMGNDQMLLVNFDDAGEKLMMGKAASKVMTVL